MTNWTVFCLVIVLSSLLFETCSADPDYSNTNVHVPSPRDARSFSFSGQGIYDFLFGPYPRRPYNNQRPSYNRPAQDFVNDKAPDYDLYLAG